MRENGKSSKLNMNEKYTKVEEIWDSVFDIDFDAKNDYDRWEEEQVFLDSLSEFNFLNEELDDDW